MKNIRKLISIFTALYIALTLAASPIFAVDNDTGLDNTDLLIVAHNFMGSDDELWPTDLEDLEIVPLYDLDNNVIAQYLKFSNAGYAVINNDKNNPAIIEFGYEDNTLIRDILNEHSNPHIIYNNPVSVYELSANDVRTINNEEMDYSELYAELNTRNHDLANMLSQSKQIVESAPVTYDLPTKFGFVTISGLPQMDCNTKTILRVESIRNWGTTSLPGKDNCGAVAAFNLAFYYSKVGFSKLYTNHTDTYAAVYAIVGDGPAVSLTPKIKKYIENCGYTYNTRPSSNYASIRSGLDKNHTVILCISATNEAHWVVGVGYNYYTDGTMYVRLVDGWNTSSKYYYQPNHGSLFVSGYEIWPTN